MSEPLNFVALKQKLVAMGFKQRENPYCDHFKRCRRYPWWKFWHNTDYELIIVGHLVWFYEKHEADWSSDSRIKTWGTDQTELETLLETL